MVLDWFNETRGSAGTVADLIARRRYAQAIVALRAQFEGRSPDAKTRLQLADLLVLAGREGEAIPVLISLADEFSTDGFVAKAVAILKRIEKLEPGRTDVEERLALLVNRTYKAPPVRFAPPRRFEIGIEAEPDPQDAEPEVVAAAAEVEPPPTSEAEAASPAIPTSPPDPPALPPLDAAPAEDSPRPAVARRIRSILGRLLAARQTPAEAAPEEPPAEPGLPEPSSPDSAVEAGAPVAAPDSPPTSATEAEPAAQRDEPLLSEPAGTKDEAPAPMPEAAPPEAAEPEPLGDLPDVAPEPEAALVVAEPAGAEPSQQEATTPAGPESEPETMSHRIKGFLGRLWPGRRESEDEAGAAEETDPQPDEFDLSPVSPEPPAAAGAPPEPAREAEPVVGPEPSLEPQPGLIASQAEPAAVAEPELDTGAELEGVPELEAEPELEAADVESLPEPELDTEADLQEVPELEAEPEPPPSVQEALSQEPAPEDPPMSEEIFHERLLDVIEDVLKSGARRDPRAPARVDGRALSHSPLLGDLSDEERLKVVHGLRLLTYEPGDIILTEDEPGETLYLLTTGAVKVFVRNPASRNIEVRVLREGDFFGEVSILSGRPRTATITAASECELLELDRSTLDALGHDHPGIVDTLEAYYIERTQSPDNAAVRAAAVADAETQRRAAEVLRAHFGDRAWDPKMRLKLADVLLKANKQQEALPILVDLADAMARQGHPEKAIAILKKIERIEGRHTEEINLAPLGRRAPIPAAAPAPAPTRRSREKTSEFFQGWMVDLVKDTVRRALPSAYRLPPSLASSAGLLLSPLFEDFSDEEIQALIDGLRLLVFEAGDIVLTEGEPGNSVFVVTSGAVKVFVRSPSGINAEVCELGEGDFFGEISTLSGRPRSATVTATGRTEVLELDQATLDAICTAHPRVRAVLEEVYIQRAAHPYAAKVRGVQTSS